jgi:hypothetical protein
MNRIGKGSLLTECRHPITFQQRIETADGEGGFNFSLVDFFSVFAAIYPYRADQIYNYRSVNVEATHLIKTHGYLQLPTKTKWVGQVWAVVWSGIMQALVKLEYQINGGSWVTISASESNTGSYNWTIPVEAIGKSVIVKVTGI